MLLPVDHHKSSLWRKFLFETFLLKDSWRDTRRQSSDVTMQVNTSVSILCGATYSVDGVECRIHKLLEKAAEKTPSKIALYQDDVVVTLAELNERAAAMAECLAPLLRRRSIHSGNDVIVAVCLLPGSISFI